MRYTPGLAVALAVSALIALSAHAQSVSGSGVMEAESVARPAYSASNRYLPEFAPVDEANRTSDLSFEDSEEEILPLISSALRKDFNVASEVSVVGVAGHSDTAGEFATVISSETIELSAGTYGDPSRFLQTVAGVISDNDQRNDFLVRGGNPSENLFVIDGIEIPSINQLALSDTTGGFVSMLDAAAVQQITFHTDAYDSSFDQRLSSVVEIATRPPGGTVERHINTEVGISGAGGSMSRPLGRDGSLFFSGRQGVLQYLTNDIGLNGVPHYQNAFVRAEKRIDERNSVWGISLTGIDSIVMHPDAKDAEETNPFDIAYSGWRNTTGLNWQHVFSANSFGVASIAHADQTQSVIENGQLQDNSIVYNEQTSDRITTFKYDWRYELANRFSFSTGVRASVDQLDYIVAQPIGLQNPYSQDPSPLDATLLARYFSTVSSAAYGQVAITLPRGAKLTLGERGEQWSLGGHAGATGKALLSMPVFGHLAHMGFSQYEQLPSTLYLLSFRNLRTLDPIRCEHFVAGIMLSDSRHAKVILDAYEKRYTSYPVASFYPQVSLANTADTFGQAFLMFPMIRKGKGNAGGVELTVESHITSRLNLTETVTYSRNFYSGLDGVLRRGNYDVPLAANITGNWLVGHGVAFSWRYSLASGRPYTPDNMALSVAQNRDVYDLSRINGVRSSGYKRLDFRVQQSRKIQRGVMTWHVGLENALNNKNFYSAVWEPFLHRPTEQDQMPLFPDGGIKYTF